MHEAVERPKREEPSCRKPPIIKKNPPRNAQSLIQLHQPLGLKPQEPTLRILEEIISGTD